MTFGSIYRIREIGGILLYIISSRNAFDTNTDQKLGLRAFSVIRGTTFG